MPNRTARKIPTASNGLKHHVRYRERTYLLMAETDAWLEAALGPVRSLIDKVDVVEFFELVEGSEEEFANMNTELVCRLVDELKDRFHVWIDERFHEAGWCKWSGFDSPRPEADQKCR